MFVSDQKIIVQVFLKGLLILIADRDIHIFVENDPVALNGTDLMKVDNI